MPFAAADLPRAPRPYVLARLKEALGEGGWSEDPDLIADRVRERRGRFRGRTDLVLRPDSTRAVARALAVCHEAGLGVVPQGGNTGLVGGSIPDPSGTQVLLSLDRMRRVRALDASNHTVTVEAGCVLADVQAAAARADLLFPLSLAAEGSCTIGGNLSTNAGGTAVLRYGNARALVLGLEVVLADGRVWDGLRGLRKDNAGYALAQLFVGSEGTLGVITAAVLELFPRPIDTATGWAAVRDPEAAVRLLARLRAASGDAVTTFEYMNGASVAQAVAYVPGVRAPLSAPGEHCVLVELTTSRRGAGLRPALEGVLGDAFEAHEVVDATIAESGAQAEALWRVRETIPEAQKHAGESLKHDVAVPVSRVPELLARGAGAVEAEVPGGIVIAFGHVGDGNLHYNVTQPPGSEREWFLDREPALHRAVYDLVAELGGSFSAEHGIGTIKRAELLRYRPECEIASMRALKGAIDPRGILNPGKVL